MVTKTEKFLYSMLKNADPRALNWDLIAAENGINPNAARTRWYRFEKLMSRENAFQHQDKSLKQPNFTRGKGKPKQGQMGQDDEEPPKPIIMKARDFGVKRELVEEENLLQDVKGGQVQDAEQHPKVAAVKKEKDLFW